MEREPACCAPAVWAGLQETLHLPASPCTSGSVLGGDNQSCVLPALSGVQIAPVSSLPVGGVGMAAVLTVVLPSTAEGVILAPSS